MKAWPSEGIDDTRPWEAEYEFLQEQVVIKGANGS